MMGFNSKHLRTFMWFLFLMSLIGCNKYIPPEIHWKADPGEKYSIRLEFESPRVLRLTSVKGFADYAVSNFQNCMTRDSGGALGGLTHQPAKRVPLEIRLVDKKVIITSAYKNPMVDEDYYGLGTCEWVLSGINITLNGLDGEVVTSLGSKSLRPGEVKIICNEEMRLCVDQEIALDMPAHIRKSKGVMIITEK